MTNNYQPPPLPLVLKLASLPREQLGPFLLLGLDKAAEKETIEANWAQRVIWARKNQLDTPLEDINWAREIINDPDKRARADAATLNVDTTEGFLRTLVDRYQRSPTPTSGCQPVDVEKELADYTPPIPIPDPAEVRQAIPHGEVPREIPAVARILKDFVQTPLDPWNLSFRDDP